MQISTAQPSLILASRSPRRRELLERSGLSFSVIPSKIDEESASTDDPEAYVRILSELKAGEVSARFPKSWVIGADTTVLIEEVLLGKPGSIDEAKEMLRRLSGKTHRVLTGFAIYCGESVDRFSDTVRTDVLFKELTEAEIEWYVRTGEPFDKAGGYAIQGIGSFLVRRIDGSYTSVVGLPVCEVIDYLIRKGVVDLSSRSNVWM